MSMRYCIDASVLGSPKHFVYDDGFEWKASVPRDAWHMTGELKDSRCLDTLFRLARYEPPTIPQRYVTAMSHLVTGSNVSIPWKHVVPQETYRQYFKSLVEGTSSIIPKLPVAYYDVAWTPGTRVLSSLRPAKVDVDAFKSAVERDPSSPALESFRPGKTGYAPLPTYDRFATRTGRMTITSGPNILVLKKEHRSVLKSAFPDGVIAYLDFSALEARIVLAEAGKSSSSLDIYGDIAESQFGGSVSRDTVKTAVLSELYGASRGSLGLRLGIHGEKLDAFIGSIRRHFEVPTLRRRLKEEADRDGRILNRFGRPLFFEGAQDNLLVNTYAQSSGVDVAMIGFDSILQRLGTDGVRPLFVLHDALLLDVRGDRLDDVASCTSVEVASYNTPFPVKVELMYTASAQL